MTDDAAPRVRPTGRRPGESGTREVIADVARRHFADKGFAATTLRAIATEADVDPALIVHHFGSKRALFLEVLELPEIPLTLVRQALEGPLESLPDRLSGVLARVLGDERTVQRLEALIRTAASDPEAAARIRGFLEANLMHPIAARLAEAPGADPDEAALRATMIGTSVAGTILGRRILRLDPLAAADAPVVAALVRRAVVAQLPPLARDQTV
ncbi:TetR family transcriptional regulator [Phycicoccus sp. CSK15P-2]|uniref:TetR/AcrR family transcriptional regulator n=1 Tax=Phycicoccus sp. CSK15P-2 TaxID=2807627 RepID=UPI0019509D3A|nr:TetR/AcrR family transcriptional regulator [Phycicoccus sp. CSK15P-2]MBM6404165.1 TetR family transcriptional regulator [Phycicoccus sp. CSK15P-2]